MTIIYGPHRTTDMLVRKRLEGYLPPTVSPRTYPGGWVQLEGPPLPTGTPSPAHAPLVLQRRKGMLCRDGRILGGQRTIEVGSDDKGQQVRGSCRPRRHR
jgi:hypothetical protein